MSDGEMDQSDEFATQEEIDQFLLEMTDDMDEIVIPIPGYLCISKQGENGVVFEGGGAFIPQPFGDTMVINIDELERMLNSDRFRKSHVKIKLSPPEEIQRKLE